MSGPSQNQLKLLSDKSLLCRSKEVYFVVRGGSSRLTLLNPFSESLRKDTDPLSVDRRKIIDDEIAVQEAERERLLKIWQDERDRLNDIKNAKRDLQQAQNDLIDAVSCAMMLWLLRVTDASQYSNEAATLPAQVS